jgi:hypothetical protein
MKHAETFFLKYLTVRGELPRRKCELLAGANSIFQLRPYQRNIQTGTFRIWKDLGLEGRAWLNLWPFERAPREDWPWMFEAFPSLFWREIFGCRSRAPSRVRKTIQERITIRCADWKRIEQNADLADAAVLAAGACLLQNDGRLFGKILPQMRREGWILGLEPSAS